jgi:D-alanyl-D-alanine carboxypeptidase
MQAIRTSQKALLQLEPGRYSAVLRSKMNKESLDRALQFIDDWFGNQAAESNIPGLVLGIRHDANMVYQKAFGVAGLQSGEPMDVGHVFPIASQSKMFTATAVLILAQEGRLSLEDTLFKYLHWLGGCADQRIKDVTIAQILSHRAGLLRDGSADYWQLKGGFPDRHAIRQAVLASSLAEENIGKVKYSNMGFSMLGEVIEQVSDQSYVSFTRDHIIKPLGIADTWPSYSPSFVQRIPTGYTRPFQRHRFPVPKAMVTNALTPAGGWHSTTEDMCRFLAERFWGQSGVLPVASSYSAKYNHWVPPLTRGISYSNGFISYTLDGREVIGHGGSAIGYRTCSYADPRTKLAVVVMSNAKEAPVMLMLKGVFAVLGYYAKNSGSVPQEWRRFESSLMDIYSRMRIVATPHGIDAITQDGWNPFMSVEKMRYISPNTLQIQKAHSLASSGEHVKFTFNQANQVVSANYAGVTMLPPSTFPDWLRLKLSKK